MMGLVAHKVGKPHPGPIVITDGMQAILSPVDGGLSLGLLAAVPRPTAKELLALRERPLRLGVYASPPLAWVLLDAGTISFDAPYAVGIVPDDARAAILAGAQSVANWAPTIRGLVQLEVIDPARGNRIEVLRAVTLSADWWAAFAAAITAAPGPIDAATHREAIEIDQQQSTREMFSRARAVEEAGRL